MRKVIIALLFSLLLSNIGYATHQRAAEVTYKHIEGLTFEFRIEMWTRTSSPADDTRTYMPIFWGDGTGEELARVESAPVPVPGVDDISFMSYIGRHTFPAPGAYTVSVEDPNRNNGVVNIPNSVNVPMFIETYIVINPFLGINNSADLLNPPIDKGCVGKTFFHNPAAYDPDGDSLSYRFVVCKGAGGYDIPGYSFPKASDTFAISNYTGEILWETPVLQGEYNVAFVVEEWRFGFLVGSVRRDMQIEIVACDHDPPEIYSIDDTCVIAGDYLQFEVLAVDPERTVTTLTAFGGPFEQEENPAEINPNPAVGPDTVRTTFSWPTTCSHVRFEPFTAVFKAQDKGLPVNLVSFKTVFIKVLAPAPENLQAEALGNGINLTWEKSPCENAVGYKIYRRSGESGWDPSYCETGVPPYTGFQYIGELEDINTLQFRDDNFGNGLVHGINYCYRVTAYFLDEAESKASNEACAYLKRDVPIITHVSNDSTELAAGRCLVIWSKPTELDTVQYPGPYVYKLLRDDGLDWDNPQLIATFNGLNDTIYMDAGVNLNTSGGPFRYRVDLESLTVGFIGSSQRAASIFINTVPTDQEIRLEWVPAVPWENTEYIVYRKSPEETTYDSIGLSEFPFYRDKGLENGKTYCYVVKAIGHYSLPGLVDPLINFSQIVCDEPVDNKPPCRPYIWDTTFCDISTNEIGMIIPLDSCNYYDTCECGVFCDCQANEYRIFYAPSEGGEFQMVGTKTYIYGEPVYFQHELESVVGCYFVLAVDSIGNVSDTSNIICIGFDVCPPYELPNVFTPNNDDYNQFFVPLGTTNNYSTLANPNIESVDMTIFNRWGKIMYTTTDPLIRWDGRNQINNELCADGVYFYVCEVFIVTLDGIQSFNLKGSVTIFGSSGE